MLVFPNCKINLGLHVTEKRPDGFHNIETVFYPVGWCDALEVMENKGSGKDFEFSSSGLAIDGSTESNLIYKAWQLLKAKKKLPSIKVHLHKNIPMGAGLGGGSADAAFFINLIDQKFVLDLSETERMEIASYLGSDCAFFIRNRPLMAHGRGNEFSDIRVDLSQYYLLLVHPALHSNTSDAYGGIAPRKPLNDLKHILENEPVKIWKELLKNDFEESIFKKYPDVKTLKEVLYEAGALYTSMSGSGSAVFGIFEKLPSLSIPATYSSCLQKPASKIL